MNLNNELSDWLSQQDVNTNDLTSIIVNEVAAATSGSDKVSASLVAYKKTADYVEKLAQENNFEYSCIKALRVYSHFNTDLNIAVRPEKFEKIITLLEARGWSRRSWWSQFKEDIAERGKRKLVCDSNQGLSEIHLYPGLSWHGFEYTSPQDVLDNKTSVLFGELETYNTNHSLDMVSNIGHALFERYKFTAGEVFHVSSIIMAASADEMLVAKDIARRNGWENGFEKTVALISELRLQENVTYPVLIDQKILWSTWRERFSFQLKNRKPMSACLEMLFNWVWSGPIYKVYSKLKKFFVGQSGIEKKYGNIT